ncbi:carbamoyltransferase HypF [Streptomyces beihaiensis]|uniref:Carbamoyltransferase n=1 Tax=Streptomyces beihaiensis TaxID=2984495 RepID=A0ABT3U0M1_9ACTN|nr:carbamoyltransferase HypF [Streptomyces beihaiensis]MCX3062872.1 carbamoyltransferase HypF [Streptomyces beihaiensis]
MSATPDGVTRARRRVVVRGVVQGVGFRPFVYGLAHRLELSGHVTNTGEGVVAEVEGTRSAVAEFCDRVATDVPPLAVVRSVRHEPLRPLDDGDAFRILPSCGEGRTATLVSPDVATCPACLAELGDPTDRRYRHPFITCTHCGPRFTIVTGLPYDRANTTMGGFPLCERCAREYDDPGDRRFHAQPVSCHDCGPRLSLLLNEAGRARPTSGDPLARARRLLAEGAIVAVKGLGGYHLACDATDDTAVRRLRERKARGDKPFAVMAKDLREVEQLAEVNDLERRLLTGTRRPIVLLRRRDTPRPGAPSLSDAVAPRCADLGVMLAYTPVHHLLLGLPEDPVGARLLVMTSGNLGGEPIVTDDDEALRRLAPLVDAWLTHDRAVHVPCDDSVVRVCDGAELPVRRSRGYAPLPVDLPLAVRPALATGGDLKNTFCVAEGRTAWLSAHIGDMDDVATLDAFDAARRHLAHVTGVEPTTWITDRHPGYRSVRLAHRAARRHPVHQVQHHHAHIASVMAENGLDGSRPVIGVAFDGTGHGADGAVWGGEFLLADYDDFQRAAHLRYTPLPGGDAAVRRPYRMALAHLWAAGLDWHEDLPAVRACPPAERRVLARQLARTVNCPPTSSMGRLFDAVSSLSGVCHHSAYEAQAAIELEAVAGRDAAHRAAGGYRFEVRTTPDGVHQLDPAPVVAAVAADVLDGRPRSLVSARFHLAVVEAVRQTCALLRERSGIAEVALSGGVFANARLLTGCARTLRDDGFTVLRHRLVPPNDGGLALGQLMVAGRSAAPGLVRTRQPARQQR